MLKTSRNYTFMIYNKVSTSEIKTHFKGAYASPFDDRLVLIELVSIMAAALWRLSSDFPHPPKSIVRVYVHNLVLINNQVLTLGLLLSPSIPYQPKARSLCVGQLPPLGDLGQTSSGVWTQYL
jgi:hypothetical protein